MFRTLRVWRRMGVKLQQGGCMTCIGVSCGDGGGICGCFAWMVRIYSRRSALTAGVVADDAISALRENGMFIVNEFVVDAMAIIPGLLGLIAIGSAHWYVGTGVESMPAAPIQCPLECHGGKKIVL